MASRLEEDKPAPWRQEFQQHDSRREGELMRNVGKIDELTRFSTAHTPQNPSPVVAQLLRDRTSHHQRILQANETRRRQEPAAQRAAMVLRLLPAKILAR